MRDTIIDENNTPKTPNELYKIEPESTHFNIAELLDGNHNHIEEAISDEVRWGYGFFEGLLENNRVTINTYKNFYFDGRRYWRLASVWFDNKPVMVVQNAGREGDDWSKRFITNLPLFKEMCHYIRSLLPEPELEDINEFDGDAEISITPGVSSHTQATLTNFYGNYLTGPFEKY